MKINLLTSGGRYMPRRMTAFSAISVALLGCICQMSAKDSSHPQQRMLTEQSIDSAGYNYLSISQASGIDDNITESKVENSRFAGVDTLWWRNLEDPILSELENIAIKNNYNVRAAMHRIEASRQMLRSAYSGYYPSIGLSAGYSIEQESGKTISPYGKRGAESAFSLGASLSWEIDIFGRVREKAKGSKASLNASRLEYDAMMLSLSASVAEEYAALRMYQAQLATSKSHLQSQRAVCEIVKARYKAGLVSKLDVAQAENMVSTTELLIPGLESNVVTACNALSTLCSLPSSKVQALISEGNNDIHLVSPGYIGVPADLLRRRPDIAEAEQHIAVIASQLGVMKKEYLPSLTLNATIGTSAHSAGDLFSSNSLSYSVAPTLSWTLFDGFARRAGVAELRAEMEAQIDEYNLAVATAMQEAGNAIVAYEAAISRLQLYGNVVKTSEEMVDLAIDRYKLGLTDFSDVSSAQMTLLSNQTSLESARADCINALVSLYKALGGGFQY